MSRTHTVYCDDTCLHEATIEELLTALQNRAEKVDPTARWFKKLSPTPFISLLEHMGCPLELIEQLNEWARLPVATPERLEAWVTGQPIRAGVV